MHIIWRLPHQSIAKCAMRLGRTRFAVTFFAHLLPFTFDAGALEKEWLRELDMDIGPALYPQGQSHAGSNAVR